MAVVTSEWEPLYTTTVTWSAIGAGVVENIPQRLELTWDERRILFEGCNETGSDFRMTDPGNMTALDYYIKTWDRANNDIEIWFASPLNINAQARTYTIHGKNHKATSLSSTALFGDWISRYGLDEESSPSASEGSLVTSDVTWVGNTKSIRGVGHRAVRLDGAGDYVNLPAESNFDFTKCVAVFARFRVNAFTNSNQTLVAKGGQAWRLQRGASTDKMQFACTGLTDTLALGLNYPVDDGEWHSALGLYDGSDIKIYVDGVIDVTNASTGNISVSGDNPKIGRNVDTTGQDWQGDVEDVRIIGSTVDTTAVDFLTDEYIQAMHDLVHTDVYTNDITLVKLGWTRRMKLEIDWSDVAGLDTEHMPVQITQDCMTSLQRTAYMTTALTKGAPNGGDVRFALSATANARDVLGAYISSHDVPSEEFTYFVNPEADINGNVTDVYMYYRCGDTEQPPINEVGGARFCFNGDGNTLMTSMLNTRDETTVNLAYNDGLLKAGGEFGTVEGTNKLPLQYYSAEITGTGRARRYTATNDKVDYGDPDSNAWNAYSVNGPGKVKSGMIWFKCGAGSDGSDMTLFGKRSTATGNEGLQIKRLSTNYIRNIVDYDSGAIYRDTSSLINEALGWTHFGFQLAEDDPALGSDMHCFLGGVNDDGGSSGSKSNMVVNNGQKFSIGTQNGDTGSNQFKGSLAYGAIYSVIRSSSWFLATFELATDNGSYITASGDTLIGHDTDDATDILNWKRKINIYSEGGFTVEDHYAYIDEKQIPNGLADYFFDKVQPNGGDIVVHFVNSLVGGELQIPCLVERCDVVNKKLQLRVRFDSRAGGGDHIRIYYNPDRVIKQPVPDGSFGWESAQVENTVFATPTNDSGDKIIDRSANPTHLTYRNGLPVIVDGHVGQALDVERNSNQNAESDGLLRANTTTSTVAGKLVDTGADFELLGIDIGDQVTNSDTDEFTLVTGVEDKNTLLLQDDIFDGVAGEAYILSHSQKLSPFLRHVYGSCWVKFESINNDQTFMAKSTDSDMAPIGISMRLGWENQDNKIYAVIRSSGVGGVADLVIKTDLFTATTATWYKVSYLFKYPYTIANAKIWVNNDSKTLAEEYAVSTVNSVDSEAKMSIGARVNQTDRSRYFDGLIQQNRMIFGTDWTDDMENLSYTNENDTEDYWGFSASGHINRGLINNGLMGGGNRT